jgi:4-amino-4-deoxy-L-arabinose transferase-like glycosyltransferase
MNQVPKLSFAGKAIPTLCWVAGLCAIGAVLFWNAVTHEPTQMYDWWRHESYVRTVVQKLRLPLRSESDMFYVPPLPYLPTIALRLVVNRGKPEVRAWIGAVTHLDRISLVANLVFTSLLGLLSLLLVVLICRRWIPNWEWAPAAALLVIGASPAFYRTFGMLRGEPYLFFFVCLALYAYMQVWDASARAFWWWMGALVVAMVGAPLSRQFGIFVPLGLLVSTVVVGALQKRKWSTAKRILGGILAGLVLGYWFYLPATDRNGLATYMIRGVSWFQAPFSQPASFYSVFSFLEVFQSPRFPSFLNQFFPVLYSDWWGDYLGYFNRASTEYIARMCLFAVPVTYAGIIAFFAQTRKSFVTDESTAGAGLVLRIACLAIGWLTLAGYWVYVHKYPFVTYGENLKATYILSIAPPIALLLVNYLSVFKRFRNAACLFCLLLFAHNYPAAFTAFPKHNPGIHPKTYEPFTLWGIENKNPD